MTSARLFAGLSVWRLYFLASGVVSVCALLFDMFIILLRATACIFNSLSSISLDSFPLFSDRLYELRHISASLSKRG